MPDTLTPQIVTPGGSATVSPVRPDVAFDEGDHIGMTHIVLEGSGEWPGGIAPPGSRRTRRKSLDLPGSHRPTLGARDEVPMSEEPGLVLTNSLQPRPGA